MKYLVRKSAFLLRILVVLGSLLFQANAFAEEVTGCPLGLRKGKLWIREAFKYSEADEYYNSTTDSMENLPSGWHQEVWNLSNRIGYGLTDRIEAGLLLPYKHVDVRKKEQGKWVTKHNYGLEDIWLSGGYKIMDNPEGSLVEAVKLGAGINFDTAPDDLVKDGIGDGAKAVRVGLLSHEHLTDRIHLCNHLYYDWIGEARDISGWSKSNWDYGNKIGYKFFVEYGPTSNFRFIGGPIGWAEIDESEKADGSEAHAKFYNHMFALQLAYLPTGDEMDHKKIFIGVKFPYEAKNNFSPNYLVNVGWMWTF